MSPQEACHLPRKQGAAGLCRAAGAQEGRQDLPDARAAAESQRDSDHLVLARKRWARARRSLCPDGAPSAPARLDARGRVRARARAVEVRAAEDEALVDPERVEELDEERGLGELDGLGPLLARGPREHALGVAAAVRRHAAPGGTLPTRGLSQRKVGGAQPGFDWAAPRVLAPGGDVLGPLHPLFTVLPVRPKNGEGFLVLDLLLDKGDLSPASAWSPRCRRFSGQRALMPIASSLRPLEDALARAVSPATKRK